jgi:hypothetical protein
LRGKKLLVYQNIQDDTKEGDLAGLMHISDSRLR